MFPALPARNITKDNAMTLRNILLTICLLTGLSSCGPQLISLPELYPPAVFNQPARHPLVFIHGFTGARLVQRGTDTLVWGGLEANSTTPDSPKGFKALALPVPPAITTDQVVALADDVYAPGPLLKVHYSLLGIPLQRVIYHDFVSALHISPTLPKHRCPQNAFCFVYDWRRDNVANARLLGDFLAQLSQYLARRDHRTADAIRFDIVAHSMGAIIARYYLMYGQTDVCGGEQPVKVTWAGAAKIARLVQIAPPHNGSLYALQALLRGKKYSFLLPTFPAALFDTFPALYQMLPPATTPMFLDQHDRPVKLPIYQAHFWRTQQWGLFAPDQSTWRRILLPNQERRLEILENFLQALLTRAQRFQAALHTPATRPCPVPVFLYASASFATQHQARVSRCAGLWQVDFQDARLRAPGDGLVTLKSALGSHRFQAVYLYDGRHLEMLNERGLLNNLLSLLLYPQRTESVDIGSVKPHHLPD